MSSDINMMQEPSTQPLWNRATAVSGHIAASVLSKDVFQPHKRPKGIGLWVCASCCLQSSFMVSEFLTHQRLLWRSRLGGWPFVGSNGPDQLISFVVTTIFRYCQFQPGFTPYHPPHHPRDDRHWQRRICTSRCNRGRPALSSCSQPHQKVKKSLVGFISQRSQLLKASVSPARDTFKDMRLSLTPGEMLWPPHPSGISMKVPPPLAEALKIFRQSSEPRWLWCDAICMYSNQPWIKYRRSLRFEPLFWVWRRHGIFPRRG